MSTMPRNGYIVTPKAVSLALVFSVRVDSSLRIVWASSDSVAVGIRVGSRLGSSDTASTCDLVNFARSVGRVLRSGRSESYRSSLGMVLLLPSSDQTVTAYLVPDALEVGSDAHEFDSQGDDLITGGEAVA